VSFETLSAASPLQAALFLAASAALVWLCAATVVWASQERIIFRPDARRIGEVPPRFARARLRLTQVTTPDGLELTFWAADPLPGRPTLVVFHGNAGNAADRAPLLAPFAEAGYGLVLAEYRGYGGNPGCPSEAGFLADARAYLDWVAAAWGDASPALVRHPFDNLSRLPSVRAPLLVLHGEDDPLIPAEHGRRVVAAAGGPAELVLLRGVGHPVLLEDTEGRGIEAVRCFLIRLTPAEAAAEWAARSGTGGAV
jgi:fermentation-respiration switch protein FrsA (DUF1100 family)